jgi:hypothetical protein
MLAVVVRSPATRLAVLAAALAAALVLPGAAKAAAGDFRSCFAV